jgi:hypothetical protein
MSKENNKETALRAQLESKRIVEAAQNCGLSEKTLRRHLEDDEFTKEYRAARRLLYEQDIMKLRALHRDAIDAQRNWIVKRRI